MKPFWHPLSGLYIAELRAFATPALIRMVLGGEGSAALLYAGDRMDRRADTARAVRVERCGGAEPRPGDAVVAAVEGIPDLLRVVGRGADGRLHLQGDSDPFGRTIVEREAVLARAGLPRRRVGQGSRHARRLLLDLEEALRHGPDRDASGDPAASVRDKYDVQAPFYAAGEEQHLDDAVLARLRRRVAPPGPLLVVGSGSGAECFSLARAGYRVRGVDFAPRMIEHARRGARERGLHIEFLQADVRRHHEEPRSLGGVLFTADVFSFLPERACREDLLRSIARWLAPEGVLFLSARRVRRNYERAILTLQRVARGGGAWGDSHTRYLAPDGSLRRSYVHYFSSRRLGRELRAAGLVLDGWTRGHAEVSRAPEPTAREEP